MYQSSPRSQADLKYHNLILIYDMVKKEGPISRADLAKRTGLSATSMTRIIGQLIDASLVEEHSVSTATLGRPSTLLSICADAGFCLCVDAVVNRSTVSLIDLGGTALAQRELAVPAGQSFEAFADALLVLSKDMLRETGANEKKLACCGMSVSGHVIHKDGRIAASSQFDWVDVPAAELIENAFDVSAYVENDCKAALIGEEELLPRDERRAANIAYIKLGYGGVGSAAIVDGRLLRGSRNAAGEIGHFSAQPEGNVTICERRGSLESMISEAAVIARAQRIDPDYTSIEMINAGLEYDDRSLISMVDDVSERIAIAISEVADAYNPDTVILNGNLVTNCPRCFDGVKKHLGRRLIRSMQPNLMVRLAQKGANAGLFGIGCVAARHATEQLIMKIEAD